MKTLSKNDLKAAQSLKAEAKKTFGSDLRVVIVYGSRAEGKAKKDSDLDIFILVKRRPGFGSEKDKKLSKIVMNIVNQYNVYPSVVIYGELEYKKLKNSPYIYWLKKTGIQV